MSDEGGGGGTSAPRKHAYQEWIPRCIAKIKSKFHERRAKKKNEPAQDRAARRTANATVAIAVFTVTAVIVGGLQWSALHSTDEKIGEQIVGLKRQLDLMEADQRPWVYIQFPTIDSPLKYDSDGATLLLKFRIKNVGRTPASFANIHGQFIAVSLAEYLNPSWKLCNDLRAISRANMKGGLVVFPSEETFIRVGYRLFSPDVERLKSETGTTIIIYGCLDYLFQSSDRHHQTRFFYEIDKQGPNETFILVDPREGDVAAAALATAINPGVAGQAD